MINFNYLRDKLPPIGLVDSSWPAMALTTWGTCLLQSDQLPTHDVCHIGSKFPLANKLFHLSFNFNTKEYIIDTIQRDEIYFLSYLTLTRQLGIAAIGLHQYCGIHPYPVIPQEVIICVECSQFSKSLVYIWPTWGCTRKWEISCQITWWMGIFICCPEPRNYLPGAKIQNQSNIKVQTTINVL